MDDFGNGLYLGTSTSAAWTAALGALTSGRTSMQAILLKGDFTVDAKLLIPSYTIMVVMGSLTLANGVNDDMIANQHWDALTYTDTYIGIVGLMSLGFLDGNNANQSAGNCITLKWLTQFFLRDLYATDGVVYDIYLYACVQGDIYHLWIGYPTPSGINTTPNCAFFTQGLGDSQISNLFISNGWAMNGGGDCEVTNIYMGGGAALIIQWNYGIDCEWYVNSANSHFTNINVDSSVLGGIYVDSNSHGSYFESIQVTRPQVAGYNAITVAGAVHIRMHNMLMGQKDEDGNTLVDWANGIVETGSADYNLYSLFDVKNLASGGSDVTLVGTHSHACQYLKHDGTWTN